MQSAKSKGPCGLVQSIAMNDRFLLYLKKLLEVFSVRSQTCIKPNKCIVHHTSVCYNLSELAGCFVILNNWELNRRQILPLPG